MRIPQFVCLCLAISGIALVASATADNLAKQSSSSENGDVVLTNCRIKFIDQVVLASDRAGILESVVPREGDRVERGKTIAALRDDVARAALAVAEHEATNDVEIRFSKKASEVAWAEYEKAVQTNKLAAGAVPEVEVLRLKLTAEKSDLQSEQAEREFKKNGLTRDQAAAELKSYRVMAPFDGIVTRVMKSSGEAVQQGDPIAEFVNADRLRVEGFIDVRDTAVVVPNQRVTVQLEIPGEKTSVSPEVCEGKIVFVDVSVQPVTNKIRVWAEVTNRDGILKAGLQARMIVKANENETKSAAKAAAPKK